MGKGNDGQLHVEDFIAQITRQCGGIVSRHPEDEELLSYARLIITTEKALQTRAIVCFKDPELGTKVVGVDKESAKSVVIFTTAYSKPKHAWDKREEPFSFDWKKFGFGSIKFLDVISSILTIVNICIHIFR